MGTIHCSAVISGQMTYSTQARSMLEAFAGVVMSGFFWWGIGDYLVVYLCCPKTLV